MLPQKMATPRKNPSYPVRRGAVSRFRPAPDHPWCVTESEAGPFQSAGRKPGDLLIAGGRTWVW